MKYNFNKNCTVLLDTTNNVVYNAVVLVSQILSQTKSKIHIINYNRQKFTKEIFINELNKLAESTQTAERILNRVNIVEYIEKDFDAILEYGKHCTKDDFLLIIGTERLIPYSNQNPLIETAFAKLKISFHTMDNQNWNEFAKQIANMYNTLENIVNGIILLTNIYKHSTETIIKAFDECSEINISTITFEDKKNYEAENIQNGLIEIIGNSDLTNSLNAIENSKSKLDNIAYKKLLYLAYIKNGERQEAIAILESILDALEPTDKIVLADLYNTIGKHNDALKILKALYDKDCFEPGIMPATLRTVKGLRNEEQMAYWVNESLKIDPKNPEVLEIIANYYNSKNSYKDAAKIRRKLAKIMDEPFQYLLARILDLAENPPSEHKIAEDYINQLILKNPELESEANYRLAEYFLNISQSPYKAYSYFKKIPAKIGLAKSLEAAEARINILSDVEVASKALRKLKPYRDESDADRLGNEKINELLSAIKLFALKDKGYLIWEDFLEKTPNNVWKDFIYKKILLLFSEWNKINFSKFIKKSFIKNIDSFEFDTTLSPDEIEKCKSIKALRYLKNGAFNQDGIDNVKDALTGALMYLEQQGDSIYKYIGRYYASISYSLFGEFQTANNHAITLLYFAQREEIEINEKKCLMFGLMSWGYSQYRLGNQVEGIICVLSAMEICLEVEEIIPFIEDGVNILYKFLGDNKNLILHNDNDIIAQFFNNTFCYTKNGKSEVNILLENYDEVYDLLSSRIKTSEEKNASWAIDVVQLISICEKIDKIEEALSLIEEYSDTLIPLLNGRLDSRPKILLYWAEFLIRYDNNNGLLIASFHALEFLEIAINDIESLRKVSHKTERAYIGESAQDIYRFYLQVLVFIKTLDKEKTNKKEIKQKIEKALSKLLPRAILEQKQYLQSKNISSESIKAEKNYYAMLEELSLLEKRTGTNHDTYIKKAMNVAKLLDFLKANHPHYKSLANYQDINFDKIRDKLKDNELIYQYIKTKFGIVYVRIDKNEEDICYSLLDPEQQQNIDLSQNFLSIYLHKGDESETIISCCDLLSEYFYKPLLTHLSKNKDINKIYVMSDIGAGSFSPNLIRNNGDWLINQINAIENILEYESINKETANNSFSELIISKTFGKQDDHAINKIREWTNNYTGDATVLGITGVEDDISTLNDICKKKRPKILILSAHGVLDPSSSHISGAVAIEGRSKIIRIEELVSSIKYCEKLILISCRGGALLENQVETNSGLWGNIIERPIPYIILCKWDVPVEPTIKILNSLISNLPKNNYDLSKSLLIAQKELLSSLIPVEWAGLECWKN